MAKSKMIKKIKKSKVIKPKSKAAKKKKIEKVMDEFKSGDLHSGSKKGPKVVKKDQAIAIALSEAGKSKKKKKPKK